MKKIVLFLVLVLVVLTEACMAGKAQNNSYVADVAVAATSGWVEESEDNTWTYLSENADANAFIAEVNADVTEYIYPSIRVRLKQGAGYVYFIVHDSSYSAGVTSVTLFGGTDYDLADAEITDVAFSLQRFPLGFSPSSDVWSVEVEDSSTRTSSTINVYVQVDASHQVTLCVGEWDISFSVYYGLSNGATSTNSTVGLSTTTASFSNMRLTRNFQVSRDATVFDMPFANNLSLYPERVTVDTEETYYLIVLAVSASGTISLGQVNPTVIRAVSGYY